LEGKPFTGIGPPFLTIIFFVALPPWSPFGYATEGKRSRVEVWVASTHNVTWHASFTISTWLVSVCNLFSDENTTLAFCSDVIHRYPPGDGFPINQATLLCTHQSVNALLFLVKVIVFESTWLACQKSSVTQTGSEIQRGYPDSSAACL